MVAIARRCYTGALIADQASDRQMWALHAGAMQRGVLPVVPAGCIVEAWRGARQPPSPRLLDGCDVEPLSAEQARRAGALRCAVPDSVGPVDATVAETAVRRGWAVVTSDRLDIEVLGSRRTLQIVDV